MDNLSNFLNEKVIWSVLGILFLVFELMFPGLILLFFAIGAWVVFLLLFLVNLSINSQLVIFLIASLLSLILLRKYFKKYFGGHKTAQNTDDVLLDDFIGQKASVEEDIFPPATGKVSFRGTTWEADADEKIQKGSMVEILGKHSIKLIVKLISN
ncbi:MAG: NfeD family protein [Deltaproteobacteria bacterium]|nr:NfeD family protein [Deltaproteobacteria bacterium]